MKVIESGIIPRITQVWDGKEGQLLKAIQKAKDLRIEVRLTDGRGRILLSINKFGDVQEEMPPPYKVAVIDRLSFDVIEGNPKRRSLAIGVAKYLLGVNLS